MDSNPDSDHLSHVDCDPDSNPDSGPGARVNAAYDGIIYGLSSVVCRLSFAFNCLWLLSSVFTVGCQWCCCCLFEWSWLSVACSSPSTVSGCCRVSSW